MKRRRLNTWLLIVLLFGVVGYLREFFFVHMNNILYMKYYNRETALKVPVLMQFFLRFEYATLYYSKYFFTIVAVTVFYLLNYFALRALSDNPRLRRTLLYSYICMFILSALAMGFGFLVTGKLQNDEYTLSRWLMGVAQSPIICLILLASEKLYYKSQQQ